jgi:hypothetical protein
VTPYSSSGNITRHPYREMISPVSTFTRQRGTIRQWVDFRHLGD